MNIKNTAIYSCNNDCISEINNTQVDNAKYIDVIMPRYTDAIANMVCKTISEKCVLSNDTKATTFALTNTNFMFHFLLYQLMTMQNCLNNEDLVSKEQLIGININQKYQYKHKIRI